MATDYFSEEERLLRAKHVLGIYPVSESEWWKGVKEGRYPQPIRISPKVSVWRLSDIKTLLAQVIGDTPPFGQQTPANGNHHT